MRATTRARLPSSLRSGGAFPSDQYETTSATPSSAASSAVRAWPAAATAGSSTSPSRAGDQQQQVGHAGVELLGQRVVGPLGLGGRVVESAGREVIGDAAAEGTGDSEQHDGGDDDGPGVVRGESGEPGEHGTASLGRG